MGEKIGSMHIRNANLENIKNKLPQQFIAREISPNWVTILGGNILLEDFEFPAELSAQIDEPLMAFFYFEGDTGIMLYENGEAVADFGSQEGVLVSKNNINKIITDQKLDESLVFRLNRILECEDMDRVVIMLEEMFGVRMCLYNEDVDYDFEQCIHKQGDEEYQKFISE